MKALILCGSGNRKGFTWEMCIGVSEGLEASGITTEVLDVSELDIRHCNGCGGCGTGGCTTEDDMDIVFSKFSESDVLVMATPIRFSGPSSLIKEVMDRFQPIWHGYAMKHPAYAAGLMCGGSQEARFSPTITIFRAFAVTAGMKWAGELTVAGTDRMEVGDVRKGSYDFGTELADRVRNDGQ